MIKSGVVCSAKQDLLQLAPLVGGVSGLVSPEIYSAALSGCTRSIEAQVQALRNPVSPSLIPARRNGKTLEEELFDATAGVKVLTAQVAMHLDKEWRERLFRQIDSLHDPDEWDESDRPIRQGSFATFLKAICQIQPEVRPGLGLSHGGNIVAFWATGTDRLTIEFLPGDRVRWVLSRVLENGPEQYAGHAPVARLLDGLKPHNPEKWFVRAD